MSEGYKIDLSGKVAVVTGASSGIGAAIARHFTAAGAETLAVGRDLGRLQTVCSASEERARPLSIDVTSDDAPKTIVESALGEFGRLDILVHAAGLFFVAPLTATSDSDLDLQWDVNVRAPFRLTREAVPSLGSGSSVIFISSTMGASGAEACSAYGATKGAVEMLVANLAVELAGSGIRVNCIAPGPVETPMNEEMRKDASFYDGFREFIPAGRWGVVDDIAPAAVFLASDAAGYFHGSRLAIDGGWVAR